MSNDHNNNNNDNHLDNDDNDDLYDDVMNVKPAAQQQTSSNRQQHAPPLPLTEQVQMLQQRVDVLEQENENLKRNIGTLYRTAKAELQRKEDQIQQLLLHQKEE